MHRSKDFTDGRIHVTLQEGAFDLKVLSAEDRTRYELALRMYVRGCDVAQLEHQLSGASTTAGVIVALCNDLCQRIALEGVIASEMMEDLCPWRPEEVKAVIQTALG